MKSSEFNAAPKLRMSPGIFSLVSFPLPSFTHHQPYPITILFITFFFIGRIKKIPGTLASLISLVPGWIILNYTNTYIFLLVIIVYTVISYFYTVKYIKTQNDKDPKEIVADEVVAMWTILLFIPINIQQYILCFIIFRFFEQSRAINNSIILNILQKRVHIFWMS